MFQMVQHGESIHSALPWDIPWWMPDHFVFFGVLYLALFFIGTGVGIVVLKSVWETYCKKGGAHH